MTQDGRTTCQPAGMQHPRFAADESVARGWPRVATDVAVAILSASVAVGESDITASVDSGPLAVRVAAALWFFCISARRFAPVTCLWLASGATVAVALTDHPLTNVSLATALALAFVLRTRPLPAALALAALPTAAALAALTTDADGRRTWWLAVLVHLGAGLYGVSSRRAAHNRAELEALSRQHAVDAERARLARDLHDAVGHAVTLMLTYAGAARLSLPRGEGPVHTALSRIEESGRAAMADLDRVLQVLDPDGSTVPALDERLRALVRIPGVRVSLRFSGTDDGASLPGAVQEAVYRIVQEALTNVVRHSGATSAEVVVQQDSDHVRVT
jgi:signal transduction histidine kinase